MKILTNSKRIVVLTLILTIVLTSCIDHTYETGTIVHPDGSLDRKVVCLDADSLQSDYNIFGVNQTKGWEVEEEQYISRINEPDTLPEEDGSFTVSPTDTNYQTKFTFTKHFNSVEEANQEMDEGNGQADTLFRIRSTFQKKFRWFVTYLDYSDVYLSMNRFHNAPVEDYFAPEDYAFIGRIPGKSKHLSKADVEYCKRLDSYIQNTYYREALLLEYCMTMVDAMHELKTDTAIVNGFLKVCEIIDSMDIGLSSLEKNESIKDSTLQRLLEDDSMFEKEFRVKIPTEVYDLYYQKVKDFDPQIRFMREAYGSDNYEHSITMPWKVVCTNADSISGSELFWKPPVQKFTFSDYTMTATSRKLNLWAWIVTALAAIGIVGLLLWKLRR